MSNIWNELQPHLLDYISETSYEIWFKSITDAKQDSNKFIIYPKELIVVKHLNEYYKDTLLIAIQNLYSKDIDEVKIELGTN